jgi:flagellar hook-associated protein 2
MASSGLTNTASFNGSSAYAAQLQNVISTAVSRASAPITQLQTEQTSLTSQQNEIQNLVNRFSSVQSALTSIDTGTGLGSYTASVADTSVMSASLGTGAMPGTYNVSVSGIGAQTNTLSAAGSSPVSDPATGNISASTNFTLTLNGQKYSINDASGSLDGLAQAITASAANVEATVVNVGSGSAPDYRLSIQSLSYAPDTIQLNDGNKDLLSTISPGAYVTYQVNGQPSTPINSSSRSVTISPGLTVQLQQAGSTSVTVSQSTSAISSALSSFASAYNAVAQELLKNRGQSGGALSGQSIVYELQNQLRNLATYSSGSGAVNSLASLGLTFDQSGNLQFDSSKLDLLAQTTSSASILDFLGSRTSGGFLQAATETLSSVTDNTTGLLSQTSDSIATQLSDIQSKISADQSQVSQLQQTLTTQMANADATIASLQNQVSELTNLFTDMQVNSRSYSA